MYKYIFWSIYIYIYINVLEYILVHTYTLICIRSFVYVHIHPFGQEVDPSGGWYQDCLLETAQETVTIEATRGYS